jgi:hypothetical protein
LFVRNARWEATHFKLDGSDFYSSNSEFKATVKTISRLGQKPTVCQGSVMMVSAP